MACFLLWAEAQWFVHSLFFAQMSLVLCFFLPTEKSLHSAQCCWRQYRAAPSFPADSESLLSWTEVYELVWSWAWAWGCQNQTCHLESGRGYSPRVSVPRVSDTVGCYCSPQATGPIAPPWSTLSQGGTQLYHPTSSGRRQPFWCITPATW